MKLLRQLIQRKNFWPILIVVFFAVLAGRTLLFQRGYFMMHDDLQMMRQLEMEKCFLDKQIPCRWVPDMGYGYGFPLFNYYPPLPYLIGEVFRLVGFSFVETVKLVFALSFIVSGITMYFLVKEFFGRTGGVISSIFYVWAPYHAIDVYVRGAMNEAWALAWFPLILVCSYRLITNHRSQITKWIILLSISWFTLLMSHNLMVLIFTPVFAIWCLIWLVKSRNIVFGIKHLVFSGLTAFALSAFFTLPSLIEQKYVQVNTLVVGYYEYIAHFATISQLLFSRFWGYGASVWAEADEMPFQIGHFHWILSLAIGGWVIYCALKKKKFNSSLLVISYSLLFGWFSLFMAHVRSTPIWQLVPPLKFVQFPWRFLTLSTLSFSFVSGFVVVIFKKLIPKYYVLCTIVLVIALVAFNWNYFLPKGGKLGPLTDEEKFSGAAWDMQRTAGIYDYLPKYARQNPRKGQSFLTEILKGDGEIANPKQGTNWASFDIKVASETAEVRIGIYKFPNWKTFVDGKEVENYVPEEEMWGRMHIEVSNGNHKVNLKLYDTPARTIGNTISLLTWFGLLAFLLRKRFYCRRFNGAD